MCVLLNGFGGSLAAARRERRAARLRGERDARRRAGRGSPLGPLLDRVGRDYVDDGDLTRQLRSLFDVRRPDPGDLTRGS